MDVVESVKDFLLQKYKEMPSTTRDRVKYGLQWVLNSLECIKFDTEVVVHCEDCQFCYRSMISGTDDRYCIWLEKDTEPKNYCAEGRRIDEYE